MAEEAVKRRLPDRDVLMKVLYAIICIAILICLVFIYFLGVQLRYEYQAAGYVARGQHLEAADRYLKAYDEAAWGHDRYLYLTGSNFLMGGDHNRAMDFFIKLNSQFPQSMWVQLSEQYVTRILEKLEPSVGNPEMIKSNTQLGQLRAQLRASYKRVVNALKDNKSGVSNQLVIEYEAYKKYNEAYRKQLQIAYKNVAAGIHPEKLDNPNAP